MLLKNEIREVYSINKETMWKTIIFTSVLTFLWYIIIMKEAHHHWNNQGLKKNYNLLGIINSYVSYFYEQIFNYCPVTPRPAV